MATQEAEKGYRVQEDGTDSPSFLCNQCEYTHKKEGTMKSHITRQHVKKTKNNDGAKPVETEEEALAALAEWDRPIEDENDKEEVEQDEEENHEEGVVPDTEVAVINDTNGQEGNLEQAVARIKHLEEEGAAKEEVLKKMETELETA